MQVAGWSYLAACFAALFAPAVSDLISPAILLPPLIGESSFCLWLLVKGVNVAMERTRQPSQRPKNLKVRSQACCDQTGSYWVAGIRCGPTAVSLAKA